MPLHISSTCPHNQEVKIVYTTSGCDDTRGCVMQFWPPDYEHMCSKHVEAWNKTYLKQKCCASSWLNTEINISMLLCTPHGSVPGERSRCRSSLTAGRSGDRMRVEKRFSASFHTGPGAHPASYIIVPCLFPLSKAAGALHWPPTPI